MAGSKVYMLGEDKELGQVRYVSSVEAGGLVASVLLVISDVSVSWRGVTSIAAFGTARTHVSN